MDKGREMLNAKVDLIIITFNSQDYLEPFLKSIQKFVQVPYALYIIDNASSDKTQEILEDFKKQMFTSTYPLTRLRVVYNNNNLGYARAVNQGVRLGKSPYILILNADLLFLEDSVSKMLKIMEEDKNIGVLGPKLINEKGLIVGAGTYGSFQKRFFKFFGEIDNDDPDSPFNRQTDCINVCGAVYLTRRDLFEELGGFDEDFFLYYEEEFFSFKVQILKKMRVVYTPITKIIHYWKAEKFLNPACQRIIAKSRGIFLKKCYELGLRNVQS